MSKQFSSSKLAKGGGKLSVSDAGIVIRKKRQTSQNSRSFTSAMQVFTKGKHILWRCLRNIDSLHVMWSDYRCLWGRNRYVQHRLLCFCWSKVNVADFTVSYPLTPPGNNQYAFSSFTVFASRIFTVASTANSSAATCVQASPSPAMQSQWAATIRPSLSQMIHGLSGLARCLWECITLGKRKRHKLLQHNNQWNNDT